jgi:hypothetical protein
MERSPKDGLSPPAGNRPFTIDRYLREQMESVPSPAIELLPDRPSAEIRRGGASVRLAFDAPHRGETLLYVNVRAPAVDWAKLGAECALITISIDGRHASDLVVLSERKTTRGIALGHLDPGPHVVRFHFSDRSPRGATRVTIDDPFVVHATEGSEEEIALRHAPIIYGRSLPELGGPLQNTFTDAPVIAWHGNAIASGDGRAIEYSALWTHEDGGTDGNALMARWGRTTDIEWVYRVEVDERGDRIPGSAVFQGTGHEERAFQGAFEADHPVLQTCTDNNMVDDRVDGELRFFLAADETLDAGRARESVMERHPWIHAAMAGELSREGRLHSWNGPEDPSLGDARGYLYLEFDAPPLRGAGSTEPLFAIGVRLVGDRQIYRSDRGLAELAISARGPQSTAVRLPPGIHAEDIEEVSLHRVGGVNHRAGDIVVSDIMRMFLLDASYQPRRIRMRFPLPVRIGSLRRKAVLWSRIADPTADLSRFGDLV